MPGEIVNFPGVSAPYEVPERPDLVLRTDRSSVDAVRRSNHDTAHPARRAALSRMTHKQNWG